MATKRWIGNAPKIAQVNSFTFAGTWESNDVVICTIGTKAFSMVTGSTVAATIVASLVTAWNALANDGYQEFAEMTASANSAVFILTADTAGKPFTCTISTTETGGGAADAQTIDGATTSTGVATTANSGPNVASLAGNWDTGTVPVDADAIVFDQGNVDCLYDLDQNGVTPASLLVDVGYTGKIGLPPVNVDSTQYPYFEYRETYLKYGNSGDATNIAVTVRGGGSRLKYSAGTSQATFRVDGSGQAEDSNIPAVLLKSTHASTVLHVSKGDVGFAFYGGESGTLLTVNVGYQSNVSGDSSVKFGTGVTLTAPAITVTGGYLEINSAITGASTLIQYAGVVKINGTGGLAAGLSVRGGQCIYNTTGTLGGAPVVSNGGHLDFSQDLRTKTVTNPIDIYGATSKISDPGKVVTSLIVDLDETAITENISLGTNIRLTRGTPA